MKLKWVVRTSNARVSEGNYPRWLATDNYGNTVTTYEPTQARKFNTRDAALAEIAQHYWLRTSRATVRARHARRRRSVAP